MVRIYCSLSFKKIYYAFESYKKGGGPLASWLPAYGRGHFKAGPGSLKRRAIEKPAVAQEPE